MSFTDGAIIPDPGLQQVTPGATSAWRTSIDNNPLMPNQPGAGSYAIQGSTLLSGTDGGISGSQIGSLAVPNTAVANPTANAGTTTPTATATPTAGSLADYFARAIIIILGFIFVAIGLNMLRPGTVPIPKVP